MADRGRRLRSCDRRAPPARGRSGDARGLFADRPLRGGARAPRHPCPALVRCRFTATAAALAAIVYGLPGTYVWWSLYGLGASVNVLAFTVVNDGFAKELAGRANTAVNLITFTRKLRDAVGSRRSSSTVRAGRSGSTPQAASARVRHRARAERGDAGVVRRRLASRGRRVRLRLERPEAMHLHILGICGTFMGGLAAIATAAGHRVTGCDANVYPPMSTQLEALGIALTEGFDPAQLEGVAKGADAFVIGNVDLARQPADRSDPRCRPALRVGAAVALRERAAGRWVLAVAGTHGKTTTASMLAWILERAGLKPGFLIGGVPLNFGVSARLADSAFFVIEADEYDTAFFDKRSKFVHYRPRTAILNNLEYDHADIFPDLAAIETQFHHLVRTVPPSRTAHRQRRGGEPRARARARLLVARSSGLRRAEFSAPEGAPADWTNRRRRQRDASRRAAGIAALAARAPAARPAQSTQRARGARRGAAAVSRSRPGIAALAEIPRHQASPGSRAAPRAGSPSTTISRIIRRRSRRRSRGLRREVGRRADPRGDRAATRTR